MWGRIEDADCIMVYHTLKVTKATIERLTNCKLIVRCGVGYDNVDHAFARSRGIPVANVPDYGTEEVADSAIGLMLALTRGIAFHNIVPAARRRRLAVPPRRAALSAARPDVRHPRPGPHRHRRRAAGQGPRHGRRLSTIRTSPTATTRPSACAASKRSTNCWRRRSS